MAFSNNSRCTSFAFTDHQEKFVEYERAKHFNVEGPCTDKKKYFRTLVEELKLVNMVKIAIEQ